MKKSFLFTLSIIVLVFTTLNVSARGHSAHYHQKKSTFEELGQTNFDVFFIGDSITERAIWTEMFPGISIANRGIGSDRTDGILKRMDTILNTNAKKAFIMVGINDISKDIKVSTIFENYRKIVAQLLAADMQVIIQSTLFNNQKNDWNEDVVELNKLLRSYAAKNDILFVDLNPNMSVNGKLKETYSTDGLHLNGLAYAQWQQRILQFVY